MRVALMAPALCAVLCGCVSLNFSRGNLNEPIGDAALASLKPGEADLTRCLTTLGAPDLVWEYKIDGVALAYAWVDSGSWGVSLSYSFYRYAPATSFNFDSRDDHRNGVVLFFNEGLVLESVKRGRLGELLPINRRPAALPDDIGDG